MLAPEPDVVDLPTSLRFYAGVLQFRVLLERPAERFAYPERLGAEVIIQEAADQGDGSAPPPSKPRTDEASTSSRRSDIGPQQGHSPDRAVRRHGTPRRRSPSARSTRPVPRLFRGSATSTLAAARRSRTRTLGRTPALLGYCRVARIRHSGWMPTSATADWSDDHRRDATRGSR